MPCSFSFLSVCSGIEAASVAWEPLGWKACAFAEIEKFPSAVLAHHWPETPNLGDMTKHNDWPDTLRPNLIVGGTPCQAFSVAGLRQGLADPRGNLTLVFLSLLAQFRPQWVVWENVPGVLSDKTGAFGAFLGGLGELGYGFAYRVLDAQYFGVPQRRRRVFVVGYLGDWRRAAAVLFEPESLRGDSPPSRQAREGSALGPVAGTLDSRHAGGFQSVQSAAANHLIPETVGTICADSHPGSYTGQDAYTGRLIATAFGGDIARTLSARHDSSPCADRGMDVVAFYPTNRQPEFGNYQNVSPAVKVGSGGSSGNPPAVAFTTEQTPKFNHDQALTLTKQSPTGGGQPQCVAFPLDLRNGGRDPEKHDKQNRQGVGVGEDGEPSHTLSTACVHGVATSMQVRRLTPRECERLQGFPDDHTLIPWRGKMAPDGPRYKALGNSMAVPVMRWIGERISQMNTLLDHR